MAQVANQAASISIRERTGCFLCGGSLETVLDLGNHYLTDFLDAPNPNHPKAPLELMACYKCGICQLRHIVSRDALFRTYWYRSGVNSTVVAHLKALAERATEAAHLQIGDIVVDIGCNDGTLLSMFEPGYELLGFEPALNMRREEMAAGHYIFIFQDYFSARAYDAWRAQRAKLVLSIAMFYDLANPRQFVQDIHDILHPDGLWVVEMNYLGLMVEQTAYDFIGHEHVTMYFVSGFLKLIQKFGLDLEHVEFNDLNGGSVRFFVMHKGARPVHPSVQQALDGEAKYRSPAALQGFEGKARTHIHGLASWIVELQANHRPLYAYGASTRGMTTLQSIGATNLSVQKAVDKNPEKIGRYMAGLNIPIIGEEEFRANPPAYLLVLPWGFIEEFRQREKAYLDGGGAMIVPMPVPKLITR